MSRSVRGLAAIVAAAAALAVITAFPGVAGAQASASSAFCSARESVGPDSNKAETAAALKALAASGESAVATPVAALQKLFDKKGMKAFDTDQAFEHLTALDSHYYDVCPATKVDVTATDFTYDGIPATLPAGPAAFKLVNEAPEEGHELILVKLTPAGEQRDLLDLLPMPDRKIGKFIDFDTAAFVFADAGDTSYGLADLEPGTYMYACFINEGGKRTGTPHWKHGMHGTFTVQ